MTLSSSSVLHYWSSRYGTVPVIGGDPVHTRNSAATWIDHSGKLRNAIVNTPRFELASVSSESGRQVMRLEQARSNQFLYSEDMTNGVYTTFHASVSSAGSASAPDGSSAAQKLVEDNQNNVHNILQNTPTLTASTLQTFSVFAKAGTRSWLSINTIDKNNVTSISYINLASGTTGTVAAAHTITITPLHFGWWRIAVTYNSNSGSATTYVALEVATADLTRSYAGDGASFIYLFGWQYEANSESSSYIKTIGTSVTRSADNFFWNFLPTPQAMGIYLRFVEQGTFKDNASERLFQIGKSDDSAPRLIVFRGPTAYKVLHDNNVSTVSAELAAGPSIGDTCEIVVIIDGTGAVQIYQSINGAAVTTAGPSGALTLGANWSDTRLYLNSRDAGVIGLIQAADFKLVKQGDIVGGSAQLTMNELAAFEFSASGAQL